MRRETPLTWAIAALAFLVLFLALLPLEAGAATIDLDWAISVGNQGTTTIAPGDTVRWTWTDTLPHSVMSVGGGFASSSIVSGTGTTYEVTFPSPGTFPYVCGVHSSMLGTIEVAAAAVPALSLPGLLGLATLLGGLGAGRSPEHARG